MLITNKYIFFGFQTDPFLNFIKSIHAFLVSALEGNL